MKSDKWLLVGIGNAYRHDDAAGLIIARRLREENIPNADVIEASGEGGALMDLWKDRNLVMAFDAVSSGAKPGTIFCLNAHEKELPAKFFHYSTHAFSLAEAIEMARVLGQLPREMLVYGIEGESFEAGEGLSPDVEKAVQKICSEVKEKCTNFHSSMIS